MQKCLVILSGGMDSTTALYLAAKRYGKENVLALNFNYGSKHNEMEYLRARKTCKMIGVPLDRIRLDFINDCFSSDLLKSGGKIPEGHYADKTMKRTVVPMRNGIMLSIAVGYAESNGCDKVMIGNHFGDHAIYPDCRKKFIENFAKAMRAGTYSKVKILSPFCNIGKHDIAKKGARLGVDFYYTYSCYKGGTFHCGKCGTCVERKEAFELAGLEDPTEYK